MFRVLCTVFILFFIPFPLKAQIKPAEGAALNYRITGFSFPQMEHTHRYAIQVAIGHYNNEDSFRKNIVVTAGGPNNKIIAEVPAFGKEYTWRTVYYGRHSAETKSALYHFSTLMDRQVNTDSVRLRIMTPATAHKNDYVFLDGNKALYDMEGHPVWFLPKIETPGEPEYPRDIKITPFGTITLLMIDQVYEINYNADILWKGPPTGKPKKNTDTIANRHHHEFTRLANGHYMTLRFEHILWPLPDNTDTALVAAMKGKVIRDSNNKYYQKIMFGILVEYDSTDKIVWQWRSFDYFKNSDLFARIYSSLGILDLDDTHANAFYFDEKAKTICISFRNLNRIVKIRYPDGTVLNNFGKHYAPGDPHTPLINGLFCGEHSCRESQDGYLYLFNNNICHPELTPTIIMMRESPIKKDSLEKVWEFECPMDELTAKEKSTTIFSTGGNVLELQDRAMFCCMGSAYGKTLIVSHDKKILWCAQPEQWNAKDNKWVKIDEYRGSIITREELEKLVWNEPLQN